MKKELIKTVDKLLTSKDLHVENVSNDSMTFIGTTNKGYYVELYCRLNQATLGDILKGDKPENSLYISVKVNDARAFAGDFYSNELEQTFADLKPLVLSIAGKQHKRQEAYDYIMS